MPAVKSYCTSSVKNSSSSRTTEKAIQFGTSAVPRGVT